MQLIESGLIDEIIENVLENEKSVPLPEDDERILRKAAETKTLDAMGIRMFTLILAVYVIGVILGFISLLMENYSNIVSFLRRSISDMRHNVAK